VAGPAQWALGGARWGGRGRPSIDAVWAVERSIVWAAGASGVEGPGCPPWPTFMASSQSEEVSDSSWS